LNISAISSYLDSMNWPNFNMISRLMDDVADSIHSPKVRRAFNSALDYLRPYVQSLGLRITKLTKTQAEVLLPSKRRNLGAENEMLEGAVISAASHLYNLLWNENKPDGDLRLIVRQVHLHKQTPLRGNLFLRWELPEIQRETIYAELMTHKRSQQEATIGIYTANEMMAAQVEIIAELSVTELLEWK
jgi:hypothetical protein